MTSRVYVGRLNYDVRERDLERFFKGFGRIREISIKNGFGFVEFDDPRDADDAVYELNGKDLMGDRVSVELARGIRRGADYYRSRSTAPSPPRRRYGPPTRTEYQLTVENLSSRVSWQVRRPFRAGGFAVRAGTGLLSSYPSTEDDAKSKHALGT